MQSRCVCDARVRHTFTIQSLEILAFVQPIQAKEVATAFPELFSGLGRLKGNSYKIKLREGATHHLVSIPQEEFLYHFA